MAQSTTWAMWDQGTIEEMIRQFQTKRADIEQKLQLDAGNVVQLFSTTFVDLSF